jgi:hypothetical protein
MPKLPSIGLEFLSLLAVVPAALLMASCIRGNSPDPLDSLKRPRDAGPSRSTSVAAPQRPSTQAVSTDAGSSWFKSRSEWSAARIDTSNIDPMQPIYRLTVHHSGDAEDATGDPEKHLRDFERAHQAKGWACIGYHFVIARSGEVFEARPLKYQGAHSTGDNNIGNIGVCLLGNFDNRSIPNPQRQALQSVVDRLRKQYGIKRSNVFGHRDFKTTDCPGRYVMDWIEAYKGG